jgi:hypothetical protein
MVKDCKAELYIAGWFLYGLSLTLVSLYAYQGQDLDRRKTSSKPVIVKCLPRFLKECREGTGSNGDEIQNKLAL